MHMFVTFFFSFIRFLLLNLSLNLSTDFVEQQSNDASYFALNMNIFHAAITNMYHLFILPAFMRALCHTFERVGGCVSVCVTSWDLFEKSSSAFTLPLSLQSLLNHSISWQCFDFIPSTANTHIWQWMRVY